MATNPSATGALLTGASFLVAPVLNLGLLGRLAAERKGRLKDSLMWAVGSLIDGAGLALPDMIDLFLSVVIGTCQQGRVSQSRFEDVARETWARIAPIIEAERVHRYVEERSAQAEKAGAPLSVSALWALEIARQSGLDVAVGREEKAAVVAKAAWGQADQEQRRARVGMALVEAGLAAPLADAGAAAPAPLRTRAMEEIERVRSPDTQNRIAALLVRGGKEGMSVLTLTEEIMVLVRGDQVGDVGQDG